MLSKHAKKPKARAETDAETCSEHSDSELSDQDDVKRKPAAVARTSPRQLLLPAVLVASTEDDGSEGEDVEEQPPLGRHHTITSQTSSCVNQDKRTISQS